MFAKLFSRRTSGRSATQTVTTKPEVITLEEVSTRFARQVKARDRGLLDQELAELRAHERQLLPIEADARKLVLSRIEEVEDELAALDGELDCRYRRLEMRYLRKCKIWGEEKLPAFGVYDAFDAEAECVIDVAGRWLQKTPAHPTRFVLRCRHLIMRKFANLSQLISGAIGTMRISTGDLVEEWGEFEDDSHMPSARICSRFAGVIPPEVRERIKEATPHFDQILIVAEVESWNSGITRTGDPLVVGRKGGLFWLLDYFETTGLEEWARREFSSDPRE
jgi:hypothetical protein